MAIQYKQEVGIPMGTDCAPPLANLYLYAKESRWVDKQIEQKQIQQAKQMTATSRYIDDLLTINDDNIMAKNWQTIYPKSLNLKQENKDPWKTHILDMDLKIIDKRIESSIYDKRDDFPFSVRYFPDLSGNVHFKKSHGVILGQLLRHCEACDKLHAFSKKTKLLTNTLIEQYFDRNILEKYCTQFFEERKDFKRKYNLKTEEEIRTACFNQKETTIE